MTKEIISEQDVKSDGKIGVRVYIKDLGQSVGKEVTICGWVDIRRDQGKMVFMDLRDMTGKVQGVVLTSHREALEQVKDVRTEWVISVQGVVNRRPEKNVKPEELKNNLAKVGIAYKMSFFRVPTSLIEGEKSIAFT